MADKYSISRIICFNNCRLQFKYHYIDNIKSEIETIEAFMGSRAHKALEELYKSVKNGVVRPLEWAIEKYNEDWDKNYHESIKIVKAEYNLEDYKNKGRKAIEEFYSRYYPFNQAKVVETEYWLDFKILNGKYLLNGVVDRLDWNDKEGMFEIHDYKTSGTLPTQEEADNDEQLGLYHIAVKQNWPDADRVKLVWHYLIFNKEMVSYRSGEELESIERVIGEKIEEIEGCSEYPPKKSGLCSYCGYQDICPLWKHPEAMKKLPVNEYRNNPGVVLVAKYAELEDKKQELEKKKKEIEDEQKKIEEAAVEFAEKENIRVIDGPDRRLVVTIEEETRSPTKNEDPVKWQEFRDLLIKEKKYEDISTVNSNMLKYRLRIWPKEFLEKIKGYLIKSVKKSVKLVKKY